MKTQKTKKSFRKKALLSSLSMLMVATVAVGSATFAWFTQSLTANADGLVMRATASNGLKIDTESSTSTEFKTTDYLCSNAAGSATDSTKVTKLTPANTAAKAADTIPTSFYTTTAAADSAKTAKTDAVVSAITTSDQTYDGTTGIYKEDIFCKLVGAADASAKTTVRLDSITVNWATDKNTALQPAVRFMVAYNDTIIGVYAKSAKSNQTVLTNVPTPGTSKYSECTTATTGSYTALPNGSAGSGTVELGELTQTGTDKVTLIIYLDGEDDTCFSTNVSPKDIFDTVSVNLSIPNA